MCCTCALLPRAGAALGTPHLSLSFPAAPWALSWAGSEIQLFCPGTFSKKPFSENAGKPLGGGRSLYPQTGGLEHPRIPGRSRRAPCCPCVSCEGDVSSRWDLSLLQQDVDTCAWQSCFAGQVNEQLPVEPVKS